MFTNFNIIFLVYKAIKCEQLDDTDFLDDVDPFGTDPGDYHYEGLLYIQLGKKLVSRNISLANL